MSNQSIPCTLLVDNGSHRAEATLSLRRIAGQLSEKVGHEVHPVSLLHSTKVDPSELDGVPAEIFEPFIKKQREQSGTNSFLVVPLFFGRSAAIYEYLPQRVEEHRGNDWPELDVKIAPCLVDLEDQENTDVAEILVELVRKKIAEKNLDHPAVTLVDHGTPRIAVNRVRNFLASQLRDLLGEEAEAVEPSSMERREGEEYDFNEPLLENLLGTGDFAGDVVLSMLFLSPGRHAGPGGDIAQICEEAEEERSGLRTHMADLFATHPGLIDVLAKRFAEGLKNE
ncbi:MAG: cobalamin biosynthesis protein CbiX [Verrucomicrobiales bacterium]|nr:cobalamin biosynthesis protein CbiX [Verrucomicrobiales bacterium]